MIEVFLALFCLFYSIFGMTHVRDELQIARRHNELPPWRQLVWQVPVVFLLWPVGAWVRCSAKW